MKSPFAPTRKAVRHRQPVGGIGAEGVIHCASDNSNVRGKIVRERSPARNRLEEIRVAT